MEKTLLMVKPDGVKRGLIGDIVSRFERKGYSITNAKLFQMDRELAEKHYEEHIGKSFFGELVDFITSGPVFVFVVEGDNIIQIARNMMGKTNLLESVPGTIRGDFANQMTQNVIHGSDSASSAEREIKLYFQ